MSFIGVQFDKMRVTPALDAMGLDSIIGTEAVKVWGGVPTIGTGLTVTIPPSAFFIRGRHIRLTDVETVPVPANFTGSIVITVDLTKTNDSSGNPVYDNYSVTNNQVYSRAIATNNIRTEDLNAGGKVYDLELASVTTSATAVASLTNSKTRIMNTPQLPQYRDMNINNDRVYSKKVVDKRIDSKYNPLNIVLRRQGRICIANIDFITQTTLGWDKMLDLNGFPGYRPDGASYGGILNETSYNSGTGGVFMAGATLMLTSIGRPDTTHTSYIGSITYFTNDDFPADTDIAAGWSQR